MDPKIEINDYILNFYTRHEIPREILVDDTFDKDLLSEVIETNFIVPEKGIKKKLVSMASLNSKIYLSNEIKTFERKEEMTSNANEELRVLLNMPSLKRIDLFDNSNLFGTFAVSGMVVFKEGLPSKKDYRKYKILVDKNDDYNTMKEVIYRRYWRALM
jgi:excinuclease ABC subunit C